VQEMTRLEKLKRFFLSVLFGYLFILVCDAFIQAFGTPLFIRFIYRVAGWFGTILMFRFFGGIALAIFDEITYRKNRRRNRKIREKINGKPHYYIKPTWRDHLKVYLTGKPYVMKTINNPPLQDDDDDIDFYDYEFDEFDDVTDNT